MCLLPGVFYYDPISIFFVNDYFLAARYPIKSCWEVGCKL